MKWREGTWKRPGETRLSLVSEIPRIERGEEVLYPGYARPRGGSLPHLSYINEVEGADSAKLCARRKTPRRQKPIEKIPQLTRIWPLGKHVNVIYKMCSGAVSPFLPALH